MLVDSLFTSSGFWLLLGLALLISEFFLPGLVAMFFGFGALVVGFLTWAGVMDGLVVQLLTFSTISAIAIFGLRQPSKRLLRGGDQDGNSEDDSGLLGSRVLVATDFANGIGAVQLNGAKWDAESDEPLKAGDAAWVVHHRGIILGVSGHQPARPDQTPKGA